jgi:hypothetical protein
MRVSHLSIRGDSQLMAGQAEGVKLNLLIKAYAGEVRKLADSREATLKALERRERVSQMFCYLGGRKERTLMK